MRFPALLLPLLVAGAFMVKMPAARQSSPPPSFQGHLLVATSQLHQPPFSGTVIYLIEHGPQGAMGLIVNRPLGKAPLSELMQLKGKDETDTGRQLAYAYGGPVGKRLGFVLHSADVMLVSSKLVTNDIAFTMDPKMLRAIADGSGPQKYLFVFGYAGWAANQLEKEIAEGAWLIADAELSLVFSEDPEAIWKRLIGEKILHL